MKVKFYLSPSGRSPVEDFLEQCSTLMRSELIDAILLLADGKNLVMPLSRNLSNIHPGLHELRLKDRGGQVRIFYYMKKNDAIYMLHAFKKKTQELPKKEIEIALRRLKEV